MDLRIQSVNFDATDKLKAFVEKKVRKLERFSDDIMQAEVILKLIKPEAVNNKEASIKLNIKQKEAFASKTANSFEEATDLSIAALEKQIMKVRKKER